MNDEWRLQVDPRDQRHVGAMVEKLEAQELEHDLSSAFGDSVIVSRDDRRVFLYAGTREQAEAARTHLESLAGEHGWELEMDLERWHPVAEKWEDPDTPLPADDAAQRAEREAAMAAERAESAASGDPEFEVRVDLPSRHEAVRFAKQLTEEGGPGRPPVPVPPRRRRRRGQRQSGRRADPQRGAARQQGHRRGHLEGGLEGAPAEPLRDLRRARHVRPWGRATHIR